MLTRSGKMSVTLKEVHDLLQKLQKEQEASNKKIDELLKEIKVRDDRIEAFETQVKTLQSRVEALESIVSVQSNTIKLLDRKCDDNEQYSRRMSLRITNIPVEPGENGSKCVEMAINTMNKIEGVQLQLSDIDRAHRVGASRENQTPRQMIVKFKDWNTRANVYKKRRSLNDNKVFVDLTRRRFSLKKAAIDKVKDLDDMVDYVFSDLNCRLCVKLNNGEFKYFNSEDEFNLILSSLTSCEP